MSDPREQPRFDPAETARLYADISAKSAALLQRFVASHSDGSLKPVSDELGLSKMFFDAWTRALADPMHIATTQMKFWQDSWSLWASSMQKLMGHDPEPVAVAARGDRRFKHDDWRESFLFDYIKQSYLITAKHLHRTLAGQEGVDEQTAKKVDFYTRQYIDALSPTNFVLTNPEVLRETFASGGQNLLRGYANLLEDLTRGNGSLKPRMTDETQFKLGENIAVTPGKVVFQNELMQLIQYAPATKKVYERPLLIIPPWINKYYILDLREKNSFVKWALEQGHTVFVVSWVNPDADFAHKTFEDYLNQGPLAALDAVERATGEREVNLIGFCLGGTLRAASSGISPPRATPGCAARLSSRRSSISRKRASSRCSSTKRRSRRWKNAWRSAAISKARRWRRLSTCCALTTSSGRSWSTTMSSGAIRSLSTCSTGTPTRRACRRRCTASICATCT